MSSELKSDIGLNDISSELHFQNKLNDVSSKFKSDIAEDYMDQQSVIEEDESKLVQHMAVPVKHLNLQGILVDGEPATNIHTHPVYHALSLDLQAKSLLLNSLVSFISIFIFNMLSDHI